MKKIFLFILISILALHGFCADITITSTGYGDTDEKALHDAFYHAVQNANGVYVSSKMELYNGNLTKDQIVTRSKGLIKSYQILVPYNGKSVTVETVFIDTEPKEEIIPVSTDCIKRGISKKAVIAIQGEPLTYIGKANNWWSWDLKPVNNSNSIIFGKNDEVLSWSIVHDKLKICE